MFDDEWFEELSKIDEQEYKSVPPIPPTAKKVRQFAFYSEHPLLSPNFTAQIDALFHALKQRGYPYSSHKTVSVGVRHLFAFPIGTAWRKQINLGWWADEGGRASGLRVGLGFQLARGKSDCYDDWRDFVGQVARNPALFDRVFGGLGNYTEAGDPGIWRGNIFDGHSISTTIQDDLPNITGGNHWRFFGRLLTLQNDRDILTSTLRLVNEIDRTYQEIQRTGVIAPPYRP